MFLSGITETVGSTISLPSVVLALMTLTVHNSFVCARWAGFGLSVYQPINLGPGMTSFHGLSESKGRSSCSYVKINYGNRENWRENCLIR